MGTGEVFAFVFAAIFVAAIGVFFFGGLALMIAIVLLGIAVMALTTGMPVPQPFVPPQPLTFHQAPTPGATPGGEEATQLFCPNCGKRYPSDQGRFCPRDATELRPVA